MTETNEEIGNSMAKANGLLLSIVNLLNTGRGLPLSIAVEYQFGEGDPVAQAWSDCTDDVLMRDLLCAISHPIMQSRRLRRTTMCSPHCWKDCCSECCGVIRAHVNLTLADVLSAKAR